MRNTKELQSILTAIYYINRTGNDDEDIRHLLDYAFYRILNSSTNLLLVACVGRTKQDAMPEIMRILKEDTKYIEFLEKHKK
jgi:hypothetical protein